MNKSLEYLISLQEIDLIIKEKDLEEKSGFKISDFEALKEARKKIIIKLEPALYGKYERLKERYGNSVVSVVDGVCLGCFSRLPTSLVSKKNKNEEIHNCPNCGRFLYWVE
uniref:C4-type zinc ribbon domain-containing protein n=1 Tax=candidate division WOR-3 bacterium TaxID=2052148 RepID=A0A7C4Y5Z0_UNCW3